MSESEAKSDPSIRYAIDALSAKLPALHKKLTRGQKFIAASDPGPAFGYVRDGEFRVKAHTLDDGSLIQPTKDAEKTIRKRLLKAPLSEKNVEKELQKFHDAPENQPVELAGGVVVAKWSLSDLKPDLSSSPLMTHMVPLKIAYEFLALISGNSIYEDNLPFTAIRKALRSGHIPDRSIAVERLTAERYMPIHGIVFEGNDPSAVVQVRLFGFLAFKVHFKNLAVNAPRFIYTQEIDERRDAVAQLDG